MKKIIFNKIKFIDIDDKKFKFIINRDGLFVFPSGPGLASIESEFNYLESLRNSDYVFFDSGYFVLLLKILKNISVKKFSGYLFLKLLFKKFKKKTILKYSLLTPVIHFQKKTEIFLLI